MLRDCAEDAPMAPYPEWSLEERLAGTGWPRLSEPGRERPASVEPAEASACGEPVWHAPQRWGLSAEAVAHLGDHLLQVWLRLRGCLTTRTRDTSEHAYDSLRAQLTMDTKRNVATMDRTLHGGDGQALPHCMSNSPWAGPAVCEQMQGESTATPALAHGSPLIVEESAEAQAGTHKAGASRQDNGRRGKGDVCRVDPCLTSANGGGWGVGGG